MAVSPDESGEKAPELAVSADTLAFIISKAREFDVKVEPVEPDPASNPSDDRETRVLSDYAGDPTLAELSQAIDELNEDESAELIALAWVGRGDFGREEWPQAVALARQRQKPGHCSEYLAGLPLLGDLLEEGYAEIGHSVEDLEISGR
jgi:hypothetical protein